MYDYVAGKADWLAHNLPTEGERADAPIAGMKLRHDVPTAGPDETFAAVRARVDASRYRFALVLAANRTLLGRLRHTVLAGDPEAAAQQVMELGPSTTRPDSPLASVQSHLRDHHLTYVIVTDPEGRLLGTVHATDLEDRSPE